MNPAFVVVLVGACITAIFGIIGYLFKRGQIYQYNQIKKIQEEIALLCKSVIALESDVRLINSKLWSDEKLSKVVMDAVSLGLSKWQIQMIKEGWFNPVKGKWGAGKE